MITAFIYKADAKKRVIQSADAIPRDSDAGRAALAKGGEEAKKVEIPRRCQRCHAGPRA